MSAECTDSAELFTRQQSSAVPESYQRSCVASEEEYQSTELRGSDDNNPKCDKFEDGDEDDGDDLSFDITDFHPDIGHEDVEDPPETYDYLRKLPHFFHEPLIDASNQLRLLKVARGPQGVISCILETFWADKAPEYAAVSYVWGFPERSKLISLNGHHYAVTRNCHYALSQVSRMCEETEYVWMDSICINQEDLDEKAMQVQRMGRNYKNASRVYACIGKDQDKSERVMQVLQRLLTHAQAQPREAESLDALVLWCLEDCVPNHWDNALAEWLCTLDFGRSFQALCNRTYWIRVWIIQETWLAQYLVILRGAQQVSIEAFSLIFESRDTETATGRHSSNEVFWGNSMRTTLSFSRHLPHKGAEGDFGTTHSIPPSWQLASSQLETSEFQMDILSALCHFRNARCSNFRDSVYALQHIVAWPKAMEPLVADYRIQPVELFCEILRRLCPFPNRGIVLLNETAEFLGKLRLYRGCPDLEDLRRRRNIAIPKQSGATADPMHKVSIGIRGYIEQSLIRVDARGRLTGSFQYSPGFGPSDPSNTDELPAVADKLSRRIRRSKRGVPLQVGDVCIGRLPTNSRAGDLLLRLHEDYRCSCWLVARKSDIHDVLEIVGAAVVRLDWHCLDEQLAGYTNPVFDVFMDPEDLVNSYYFLLDEYKRDRRIGECVSMRAARERFSSYIAVRERTEDDPPEQKTEEEEVDPNQFRKD